MGDGEPFVTQVRNGSWESDQLPAGLYRIAFRRPSSEARAELAAELSARAPDACM